MSFFLTGCSIDGSTNTKEEDIENEETVTEVIDFTEISCDATYQLPIQSAALEVNLDDEKSLSSIIDGNKTNLSSWVPSNNEEIVVFKLEDKALIKEFVVSWQTPSLSHNFDISTSFDGSEWHSLATSLQSRKNYIIADRFNLSNAAQTARFIKLNLAGSESNTPSGIIEFEAFGCKQNTSHNIELIDWYLSVQTDEDGNGKSDSIKEDDLANAYFNPRFFYVSEDPGLVFTSPV